MDEVTATLVLFATVLIYPVIPGPVAGPVLVLALKRQERWPRFVFWPVLLAVQSAGFFLMVRTLGEHAFGPGFLSCLIAPIFGVGTALGLRLSTRRFDDALGGEPARRHRFVMGTFANPVLQMGTVVLLMLLAPSR